VRQPTFAGMLLTGKKVDKKRLTGIKGMDPFRAHMKNDTCKKIYVVK